MKAVLLAKPLTHARLEELARQLDMPDLILPFWGYRRKMPMHQIVRLEGEGNYTVFHFADGSHLMVSLTLKRMESRLSPKVFVRPHKKNIINLMYLQGVHPEGASFGRPQLCASLVNGHRIEVSRRKATQFIRQVRGFQQEVQSLTALPTDVNTKAAIAA